MGTHEFLDYIGKTGAEPYICANLGTGSWDEAQQWVEYESDADTATTRLRKKNGRDKPWKVTYWGWATKWMAPGKWGTGRRQYGKFALEAAKLMHWTDPSVKMIAAGSSNFNADWVGWNRTVLSYLKPHVDYLSLHMYVGNKEDDYYAFQACTMELANRIKVTEGTIAEALSSMRRGSPYILPGTNGTSGTGRAEVGSEGGEFWRSAITWKTLWWFPVF